MPESPQMFLPFAEKEYVDMARACRILGVGWETVRRLADTGQVDLIEYRERGWKRIRYQSLIDFCERLRREYGIPDRRPHLSAPYLRHRDEDLLPFPLADTMYSEEATSALGVSKNVLAHLIEEGRFEAYRMVLSGGEAVKGSPWRISRASFGQYLIKIKLLQQLPARAAEIAKNHGSAL